MIKSIMKLLKDGCYIHFPGGWLLNYHPENKIAVFKSMTPSHLLEHQFNVPFTEEELEHIFKIIGYEKENLKQYLRVWYSGELSIKEKTND